MTRDFGQRGDGGRHTRSGGAPGWLWLLAGIAIGFAGAAAWMITRPAAQTATTAPEPADKAAGGKRKIAIPPKEPSRFAFYELLPNYEVVIPREAVKAAPKAAPPGARYVIQVGSFREQREADQQKAKLALLGVESKVEKVTIDNAQTWFRVRIGPVADRARVETILAQLEDNGVSGLVMQMPADGG